MVVDLIGNILGVKAFDVVVIVSLTGSGIDHGKEFADILCIQPELLRQINDVVRMRFVDARHHRFGRIAPLMLHAVFIDEIIQHIKDILDLIVIMLFADEKINDQLGVQVAGDLTHTAEGSIDDDLTVGGAAELDDLLRKGEG